MQVEKLKTIDADTLLSTPIRKTLFVVDGLIPQGLSVLSGSSKIGKSWLISDYRKMLYRDIDSCHNPDEKAKLVAKRDDCTKALAQLRKDKKTALRIIEDNPKIKENILIEENMRSRYFGLNKSRKRGYER